jgi:hypothetical protein
MHELTRYTKGPRLRLRALKSSPVVNGGGTDGSCPNPATLHNYLNTQPPHLTSTIITPFRKYIITLLHSPTALDL